LRKKSVAVQQYKSREIMDINQNTTDKLMQKSRLPPVIKTLVVLLSVLSAEITLG
jgi:hypothetical protein